MFSQTEFFNYGHRKKIKHKKLDKIISKNFMQLIIAASEEVLV